MEKLPFCFPIFYFGLIDKKTNRNQPDAINILINGKIENESPVEWAVDRIQANKYIAGSEVISAERKARILACTDEELFSRVRLLGIYNKETVVSAFHAFITKKVKTPQETIRALEDSMRIEKDPVRYIAIALKEALSFNEITKQYITNDLKLELRQLRRTNNIPDMFHLWSDSTPDTNSLTAIVDDIVSKVVQGVMSILFVKPESSPDAVEQIKNRDFCAALKALSSNGSLSAYDFYKWNNVLRIAEIAEEELRGSNTEIHSSEFDFDWFLRFFDAAGNIHADDMKQLWARVLAGEIEQPGSFSLRTIETLRNMSQAEALTFKNASSLVLEETDGSRFLFCDSDLSDSSINQKYGLNMTDILALEEAGLISALRANNAVDLSEGAGGFSNGSGYILLFESMDGQSAEFQYKSYPLSQVAIQLLPIVQEEVDDGYLISLGQALRNDLERIDVGVYEIIRREGDDLEIDLDNNLLDREIGIT